MAQSKRKGETYADELRRAGLRVTGQRIAVLGLLSDTDDHPEVADLHDRAKQGDATISVATVYRTVLALEQAGLVQKHSFDGGRARYERVDKHHHDHIVDLDTGEIVEFQSARIEQLQSEIAALLGYDVVHHRLELYCRKRTTQPLATN